MLRSSVLHASPSAFHYRRELLSAARSLEEHAPLTSRNFLQNSGGPRSVNVCLSDFGIICQSCRARAFPQQWLHDCDDCASNVVSDFGVLGRPIDRSIVRSLERSLSGYTYVLVEHQLTKTRFARPHRWTRSPSPLCFLGLKPPTLDEAPMRALDPKLQRILLRGATRPAERCFRRGRGGVPFSCCL